MAGKCWYFVCMYETFGRKAQSSVRLHLIDIKIQHRYVCVTHLITSDLPI